MLREIVEKKSKLRIEKFGNRSWIVYNDKERVGSISAQDEGDGERYEYWFTSEDGSWEDWDVKWDRLITSLEKRLLKQGDNMLREIVETKLSKQSIKILLFLDKLVVSNRLDNKDSKKAYKILVNIFGENIDKAELEDVIEILEKEGLLR